MQIDGFKWVKEFPVIIKHSLAHIRAQHIYKHRHINKMLLAADHNQMCGISNFVYLQFV